MIYQDDVYLQDKGFDFTNGGCALFSVVNKAIKEGLYTFNRNTFLADCINMNEYGILDHDCYIRNWTGLLEYLGMPYRLAFVEGSHIIDPDYDLKDDEFQLLYLYNPHTRKHHFVEGDRNDNICYDSLRDSITSETYRMGLSYIESKRVFRSV